MPLLEKITIHPKDLVELLELLKQKQHTGPVIIIDCKWSYTIRDVDDQFITDLKKSELV